MLYYLQLAICLLSVPSSVAEVFLGYNKAETCNPTSKSLPPLPNDHIYIDEYKALKPKFDEALKNFDDPSYSMLYRRIQYGNSVLYPHIQHVLSMLYLPIQYDQTMNYACVYLICRGCESNRELQINGKRLWKHSETNKCTKIAIWDKHEQCKCELSLLKGNRCPAKETDSKIERKKDEENAAF
ncbi:hypothetical protein DSO57_1006968 [Entomophthora muscae]|uniref:Uncharacterized protein n=1 Tax=Entomophthora muscae TaxID=34485 RepID=A0ACC2TI99_9FUNG|nr:hypothetical protein DSO57_1006968 [Entomophthora muscae]